MKTRTLFVLVTLTAALVGIHARAVLAADAPAQGAAKTGTKVTPVPAATADKSAAPSKTTPAPAATESPLKLADDAPTMYTVTTGDTLWGISAKFLKEPYRWPEIWNMNRDQVKDPHRIYPGDVIQLAFDAAGKPMLLLNGKSAAATSNAPSTTEKVSPQLRIESLTGGPIPSIPARAINPFLSVPMIVEEGALARAPKVVATEDDRVIVGAGSRAYVIGIDQSKGLKWQLYRPSKTIRDPLTREVLGHEVLFLGDARVTRFGDDKTASAIEITKANREINRGDRLTPAGDESLPHFSPRSPDKQLNGRIASIMDGVQEGGQYSIVTLNMGRREGLEIGHVLATSVTGKTVDTRTPSAGAADATNTGGFRALLPGKFGGTNDGVPQQIRLPDERNALLFVFRVFDRVSYALVMSTSRPLKVGDVVGTP